MTDKFNWAEYTDEVDYATYSPEDDKIRIYSGRVPREMYDALREAKFNRAYEVLEREGLVRARKGVGAFVTEEGVHEAMDQAEAAVHSTFVQGIRAARAAGIPAKQVRAAFEQALEETDMKEGSES